MLVVVVSGTREKSDMCYTGVVSWCVTATLRERRARGRLALMTAAKATAPALPTSLYDSSNVRSTAPPGGCRIMCDAIASHLHTQESTTNNHRREYKCMHQ